MNEHERKLRKNIGKKIKIARSNTNYTQEQLAEKANISTRFVSQLERGISFGSATTITNLCKVLHISPDFLLNDSIEVDSPELPNYIDDTFLQNYSQLTPHNKKIINALANFLVNLQIEEDSKKKVN